MRHQGMSIIIPAIRLGYPDIERIIGAAAVRRTQDGIPINFNNIKFLCGNVFLVPDNL